MAFKLLHSFKKKKGGRKGYFAFKLDISNAYDRVEWHLVEEVMLKMGFVKARFIKYSVVLNGVPRGKISPSRGLQQGDPIINFITIILSRKFGEGSENESFRTYSNSLIFSLNVSEGNQNLIKRKLGVRSYMDPKKYLGLLMVVG
ncbi:reverse transcriptase [Gossypium australe]|uniref:Reverse transcriptase n=1 Tax=Gossypium australe TaxID=47621 RepID=A0A5B6VKV8_9ROSI|nr:reverse transcriptase [Gossypium australe]